MQTAKVNKNFVSFARQVNSDVYAVVFCGEPVGLLYKERDQPDYGARRWRFNPWSQPFRYTDIEPKVGHYRLVRQLIVEMFNEAIGRDVKLGVDPKSWVS